MPGSYVVREPVPDAAKADQRRLAAVRALSVASPVLLLAVWELLVRLGALDARFFPAPTMIAGTFAVMIRSGELWDHLYISLARIAVGFVMGAVPGVVIGAIMGMFPWVRAVLSPLIAALYPIPKIALFPLILLLFGLGEMSKYVTVAIAVFFLMTINTLAGVLSVDRIYWDVGRSFQATGHRAFRTIALPGALPMIFAGLRLSLGVSLLVLIGTEFVGADSGIGYLVWSSWQVFAVESMYVGLIVIGFLGWLFFTILDEIERRVLPWKRSHS